MVERGHPEVNKQGELSEKLQASRLERTAMRAHELWRGVVIRQRTMKGQSALSTHVTLDISDERQKDIFWELRMAGKGESGDLLHYRFSDTNPSVDVAAVDLLLTPPNVQEKAKAYTKKAIALVNAQEDTSNTDLHSIKALLHKQQNGEELSPQQQRLLQESWVMKGALQIIPSQDPFEQEEALAFVEAALESSRERLFRPIREVLTGQESLPIVSREQLLVSPDYEASDEDMLIAFKKGRERNFQGYSEYVPNKPYNPEDPTSSQCFGLTDIQYKVWVAARRPVNILVDLDAYLAFTRDRIPLAEIPDVVYPPIHFAPWFVREHVGRTGKKYNRLSASIRRPDQPSGIPNTLDPDLSELLTDTSYTDGVPLTHLGRKPLIPYEKEMIVDHKVAIVGNGYSWRGLQKDVEGNWIGHVAGAIDVLPLFVEFDHERSLFRLMYVQVNAEGRRAFPGETEKDDPNNMDETRPEGARRTLVEELGFSPEDFEDTDIQMVYEDIFGGDQRNTLFSGRYRVSEAVALLGEAVVSKLLAGTLITNDPGEIYGITPRPASEAGLNETFGGQPVGAKAAIALLMRMFPGLAVDKDGYIGRLEDH